MNLKEQFVFYCGPTLVGIKPSSLFSLKNEYLCQHRAELNLIYEKLHKKGLDSVEIRRYRNSTLIFIYNESLIISLLNEDIRSRLNKLGYPKFKDTKTYLYHLLWKLKNDKNEFPHKIGYFLGFPYLDVDAFIKYKGKNCKCCGYWKSYVDCENASLTFQKYNKLKKCCLEKIRQGAELEELVLNAHVGG